MAVTWMPNQASFIGALDAGAQAGLRSAALRQQAMAQQAAIDEAAARQRAAEIEAQNRLNFESWYRGEQLRQQAAQDEMQRSKYEQELGYKKQQLEKAMETEAARKAYWESRGNQPAKPLVVPRGAAVQGPSGKFTVPSPYPEQPVKPLVVPSGAAIQDESGNWFTPSPKPPPRQDIWTTRADYNALLEQQKKLNASLRDPKTYALSTTNEIADLKNDLSEVNNQLQQIRTLFGPTNAIPTITATNAPPALGATNAVASPKLDADTAMRFLRDANGDKDLARKLARDAGYSF